MPKCQIQHDLSSMVGAVRRQISKLRFPFIYIFVYYIHYLDKTEYIN